MDPSQIQFSRRLAKLANLRDKVEAPDEFFGAMVYQTVLFEQEIEKLNDKEASDLVISKCSNRENRGNVGQALVCLLLTEKENSARYLHLLSQMGDSWFQALYTLNMVSIEMFGKLNESCKDMMIVYFREGIKLNVQKLDSNFINFLRTLNGTGEWSSRLRLSRDFAALFLECSEYMFMHIKNGSMFFGVTISTFSHIVADIAQHREHEREKNLLVEVIVNIVRNRPQESFQLGRELFYCLMRISKIPQITQLFNDLIRKPSTFNIKSIEDILFKAPAPYFCANRLSIEVTRKVEFLITGLPPNRLNAPSTKHLEWFTNSHLKGPDSMSMRSEIIRFAQYYYPPNQPPTFFEARMQLINYLISTATYGAEAQWCKTALWIDWLFFDSQTPPSMFYVLEPALAVVRYCLQVQVQKATSLMEYLVKEVKDIYPPLSAKISQATNYAMGQMSTVFMESKQPHVSSILENARIEASVRAELRSLFKDFVSPTPPEMNHKENNNHEKVKKEPKREAEYDDRRSPSPPQKRMRMTLSKEEREKEMNVCMNQLRDDVKDSVMLVKTTVESEESDDSDKGEAVSKLLQKILENEDSIEEEQHWSVGHCLYHLIGRPEAAKTLVPEAINDHQDPYQEIFSHPIFIVFRNLCFTPTNETTSRTPLIRIISAMREKDNFITILLLYFIKCGIGSQSATVSNDHMKCYEEVALESDKEVAEMLTEDMETLAFDDEKLFSLILPMVVEKFCQEIGSSPEVLHVICCHMDSSQLSTIVGSGIREGTTLFRKDNVCNIVTASMEWSTTAQLMLWQLIHAEAVPMDWLLPIVPKIKSKHHAEAAVNLLLTLRRLDREPGMNLLRTILSRPPSKEDYFTINCFRILIDDSDMCTRVADLMAQLIKKLINNNELHMGSTTASQKSQGKKAAPKLCLEQLLLHMQFFIDNCLAKEQKVAETLLSKWSVQEAFKSIISNDKTTMMRPKFQHLFTVLELLGDSDSPQSSRTLRGNRGNNQSKATKKKDDDDDVPSGKHKKRQVVTLDSDSD